ncbi:hypothetical protein GGR50DRAFT_338573 [Xylaria sp. CBS 124048]|nr:hypothetical protein GGR50DRAFT_338573 [Xylaria sp. CBS 124048]
MGFASGFTGGVTLTLGVAYLTVLAHQRNREQQAAILRQQTFLLSEIVDPLPPLLPPTRAELAAAERARFTEVAKDRWNAEVEHAARWAMSKDWTEVRENAETAVGRLLGRPQGQSWEEAAKEEMKKGVAPARDLAIKVKEEARETSESVAAVAKSAYADAKAKSTELASKAEEKAEATRDTLKGAIGKGIEKGRELLGQNKATTAVPTEKVDVSLSPVEKALQKRYEEGPRGLDQTVEEVLAARYAPFDETENANANANANANKKAL